MKGAITRFSLRQAFLPALCGVQDSKMDAFSCAAASITVETTQEPAVPVRGTSD